MTTQNVAGQGGTSLHAVHLSDQNDLSLDSDEVRLDPDGVRQDVKTHRPDDDLRRCGETKTVHPAWVQDGVAPDQVRQCDPDDCR